LPANAYDGLLVKQGGNWMIVRWTISALALVSVSALVSAQDAPPAGSDPASFPEVVARVNDTEISKTELLRRAEAIKTQVPPSQIGEGFYQRVLADMVSGELLYQSVETKGLSPTDAEVAAELESQTAQFGGSEAFQSALDQRGLSVEQIKQDLKREMGIQKLVERDFIPTLAVTEQETRTFYDGNLDAMQQPLEFRAAHILITVDEDATEAQKTERRQKAESIRNMVEMGQDFAELAAKNSGDPGSKDNGGELGWMSEGQTVPPFEAAMKSLEPGELSDIVETRYGYHIIKLEERRGGDAMPYDEVKERIEEFLKQRGLRERIQEELELLRNAATIEVFI
jgi:peptidyl-prolyl cis-trans isomerase C